MSAAKKQILDGWFNVEKLGRLQHDSKISSESSDNCCCNDHELVGFSFPAAILK